jgi:EAL domain-containing protein (putative c-di-GMP-specific phosphodiesterase class I)/multidrug resistance efflux pump
MNQNSHLSQTPSSVQSSSRSGGHQIWDSGTEQSLLVGEFELWYQPVYQARSYEVVHNEVLLRWRDHDGKVYQPDEFIPVLSEMGLLSQIDRYVIDKAIDQLVHHPQLSISVNLSKLALADITLLQDLRTWLRESRVEPQRLSFEIPESTIAQDFSTSLSFIRGLTALGCLVIVDNFTTRELTLSQCKQLPIDSVKLDRQFIEQIEAFPNHPNIAKRLREISYIMGRVIAKFITSEQRLTLVQGLEVDGVQGNFLHTPSATPQTYPWKSATVATDNSVLEDHWGWDELPTTEPQPVQTEPIQTQAVRPPKAVVHPPEPVVAPVKAAQTQPPEVAPAAPPVAEPQLPPASQSQIEFKPTQPNQSALSQVNSTSPVPAQTPALATTPKALLPSQPLLGKKPNAFQRLFVGTACVGVGIAVIGGTVASVWHRMSHMVINHGVINGRLVRLQSPLYGNIKEFYARPGAMVKADQVLAQIQHIPDENKLYEQPQLTPALDLAPELPEFDNPLDDYRRYHKLEDLAQEAQQDIVRFEGQLQAKRNQLASAESSKSSLEARLREIEQEREQLKSVEVSVSATEIPQRQADLDQAIAQENLARSEYERFRQLQVQGAVPAQRVDELQAAWETAKAEVQRAREELRAAEVTHNATQSGVAVNLKYSNTLAQEAADLKQQIQHQAMLVSSLSAEVENAAQQLNIAEDLYNQRQSQMQQEQNNIDQVRQQKEQIRQEQQRIRTEHAKQQQQQAIARQQANQPNFAPIETQIKAPFTSVVYKTEGEKGEIVNKSQPVVSLLDCNTLWVEAVVSAEDASRLDTTQPVHVRLSNKEGIFEGEIDLIQPISTISASNGFAEIEKEGRRMQVQALSPTIPAELMKEPFLKRVTVKVPPNPNNAQPQQLCGLGQVAQLTFAKEANPTVSKVVSATRELPTRVKNQFVGWFTPDSSPNGVVSRPDDNTQD